MFRADHRVKSGGCKAGLFVGGFGWDRKVLVPLFEYSAFEKLAPEHEKNLTLVLNLTLGLNRLFFEKFRFRAETSF